ncbi:MAG: GNAT family protein [Firmicutes bacterium]|nr:GNAT family protein [Bacillota bacterium]
MRDPLLRGASVRLTAFTDEDAVELARWSQDGEFLRMFDALAAKPKSAEQWRDVIAQKRDTSDAFSFAVRLLDDEQVIGIAELDGVLWNQGTCWLTLGIGDPTRRRCGFGRETLHMLLRYAFGELNLRRVSLTVFADNEAAIRLYERFGFVKEGVYREFLMRDGATQDMFLYGLLQREWVATVTRN